MACELYINKADFFLKGTGTGSSENNEFKDWSKEENHRGEASPLYCQLLEFPGR